MLERQDKFCGKGDNRLCPQQRNALSEAGSTSKTTQYFRKCYEKRKEELIGSDDSGNV